MNIVNHALEWIVYMRYRYRYRVRKYVMLLKFKNFMSYVAFTYTHATQMRV